MIEFSLVKKMDDASLEFERGSEFFEFGRWLLSCRISGCRGSRKSDTKGDLTF